MQVHNQLEAERRLGKSFMDAKRLDAQVLGALKDLDVRPELARRALAESAGVPTGTLEERLRAALRALGELDASGCREAATAYG